MTPFETADGKDDGVDKMKQNIWAQRNSEESESKHLRGVSTQKLWNILHAVTF